MHLSVSAHGVPQAQHLAADLLLEIGECGLPKAGGVVGSVAQAATPRRTPGGCGPASLQSSK